MDEERELTLEDEDHLTFLGLIAMMDPPREESKAAVEDCIRAGVKPIMIAEIIKSRQQQLQSELVFLKDESEACEGAVIENMSDEELRDFVEGISVYAEFHRNTRSVLSAHGRIKGNIILDR